jgi:tape measure domain-containing protein
MSSHEENIDIRTRVLGARQAAAETAVVEGAVTKLDRAVDRSGRTMETSAKHGFLWNQAMFTVRRGIYATTLAAVAGATALAAVGFQFNMQMEQNTVALSYLLHSEQAAHKELATLYNLAAVTPFEFTNITDAARRFLAFGFTVDQTNKFLRITADAVAAMGGNADIIGRVVLAFGQIQTKGRVMGQELLQLTEAGIPATRYLAEALGLSAKQLRNIGALGIPANVAIDAITRGMSRDFGGASAKLAKTVTGQLSTLRDYSRQLFGEIMMAPFKAVQGSMPGFLKTLQQASETMRDQGFIAMVGVWDDAVGAGGRLTQVVLNLQKLFGSFSSILVQLWPVIRPFVVLFGVTLYGALKLSAEGMELINHYTWIAIPLLKLLIALWIIGTVRVKALAFWEGVESLVKRRSLATSKIYLGYLTLQTIWTQRATLATRAYVFVQTLMTVGMARLVATTVGLRLALATATVATWLFTTALLANPITWIVLGIVALGVALVVLIRYWDQVKMVISDVWDLMKRFGNWLSQNYHKVSDSGIGRFIASGQGGLAGKLGLPHFATGGIMPYSGAALVGEDGPEIINLRGGSRVIPMRETAGIQTSVELPPLYAVAEFLMDGKKMARVMAEFTEDSRATA